MAAMDSFPSRPPTGALRPPVAVGAADGEDDYGVGLSFGTGRSFNSSGVGGGWSFPAQTNGGGGGWTADPIYASPLVGGGDAGSVYGGGASVGGWGPSRGCGGGGNGSASGASGWGAVADGSWGGANKPSVEFEEEPTVVGQVSGVFGRKEDGTNVELSAGEEMVLSQSLHGASRSKGLDKVISANNRSVTSHKARNATTRGAQVVYASPVMTPAQLPTVPVVPSARQLPPNHPRSASVVAAANGSSAVRPLMLAEHWATTYPALPVTRTPAITYPNGSVVDIHECAHELKAVAAANAQHRARMIPAIESGDLVRRTVGTYTACDRDLNGFLSWNDGEIRDFIAAVFQQHGLTTPSLQQMFQLYQKFDADRNTVLDARECLCLVDALLRAVFFLEPQRHPTSPTHSVVPHASPIYSRPSPQPVTYPVPHASPLPVPSPYASPSTASLALPSSPSPVVLPPAVISPTGIQQISYAPALGQPLVRVVPGPVAIPQIAVANQVAQLQPAVSYMLPSVASHSSTLPASTPVLRAEVLNGAADMYAPSFPPQRGRRYPVTGQAYRRTSDQSHTLDAIHMNDQHEFAMDAFRRPPQVDEGPEPFQAPLELESLAEHRLPARPQPRMFYDVVADQRPPPTEPDPVEEEEWHPPVEGEEINGNRGRGRAAPKPPAAQQLEQRPHIIELEVFELELHPEAPELTAGWFESLKFFVSFHPRSESPESIPLPRDPPGLSQDGKQLVTKMMPARLPGVKLASRVSGLFGGGREEERVGNNPIVEFKEEMSLCMPQLDLSIVAYVWARKSSMTSSEITLVGRSLAPLHNFALQRRPTTWGVFDVMEGHRVAELRVMYSVSTSPAAIQRPRVTDMKQEEVTVRWDPPASDHGSPTTAYTLSILLNNPSPQGPQWHTLCARTSTTNPVYVVTNLEGNTSYMMNVRAINKVGVGDSCEFQISTAPMEPHPPEKPFINESRDGCLNIAWHGSASDGGCPIAAYKVRMRKIIGATKWNPFGKSESNATWTDMGTVGVAVKDQSANPLYDAWIGPLEDQKCEYRFQIVALSQVGQSKGSELSDSYYV
eukprot:TRINITY_DN18474_c0_g2_i1.p1 TRINITY_DN18474_c0_g2~~TRINITY_DN18474_c0_g2_i1.p1  ORF type:complete len:1068 (+),score=137.42 TRINITY_DN18474_c0_g2_i1:92-3295(+)